MVVLTRTVCCLLIQKTFKWYYFIVVALQYFLFTCFFLFPVSIALLSVVKLHIESGIERWDYKGR